MKRFLALLGTLCALGLQGIPTFTEDGKAVTLSNAGATYRIDSQGTYGLLSTSYQGTKLWPRGFTVSYHIYPQDSWFREGQLAPQWQAGPWHHTVIRKGHTLMLRASAQGKTFTHLKEYSLQGDSPDLRMRHRLVFKGKHDLHWVCCNSRFPHDQIWMRFIGTVHNGTIQNRLVTFDHIPFTPDKKGDFGWYQQWRHLAAAGAYDPRTKLGAMILVDPTKPWPIRLGMAGNQKQGTHHAFLGFSSYNLSDYGTDQAGLDFDFIIHPFHGNLDRNEDPVVTQFRHDMEQRNLFPTKKLTGKPILCTPDAPLAIWQDSPTATVYPSDSTPQQSPASQPSKLILQAAQAETAMTQLVLKPQTQAMTIKLDISSPTNQKHTLKTDWSPISYTDGTVLDHQGRDTARKRSQIGGSDTTVIGQVPDILLTNQPMTCQPGKAQPFLIRVKAAADTPPGLYRGTIRILADNRPAATLPLTVRVWNFSIAKQTLTAGFDVWHRYKAHTKELWQDMFDQSLRLIVEARGGERWVGRWGGCGGWPWAGVPSPTWDKDGNLLSVDYREFDETVERALKVYKHNLIIPKFFMLGGGHVPTATSFGPKNATLTPIWKKRLLSFARNFKQHLEAKGWEKKVVLDLFDEPHPKYHHILKETITLLRSVSPDFRFTYAGAFSPELNGYIDFWNIPMGENYTSRHVLRQIRAEGGEISVYNPVGYSNTSPATRTRGTYTWLWNENITYVYQWVTNDWSELAGGNDVDRAASWVFPIGNKVCPTLRLANTLLGIQDYEYYQLLAKERRRLASTEPELAEKADSLLARTRRLAWRTDADERCVIATDKADSYDQLHEDIGRLLHDMSTK